jgi:DNA polymerase-3 subunit delta'
VRMHWNYIGQEWAVDLLRKHISRNTSRQAYLFTGPQAIGRRTLALRFAQALNCQNPPAPGEACGTCRVCKGIQKEEQADLSIIRRSPERTRILIEQVRELQHTLALAPYESNTRIALLVNFQEATEDAQNALLKVLEEPPDRVMLILTAESAESLLPTITSRCEQIRLRPLRPSDLANALQGVDGIKTAPIDQLAHISDGCPGRAIALGTSKELYQDRRERLNEGMELLQNDLIGRFAYAERTARRNEKMNHTRDELRLTLHAWSGLWRDIYLAGSGADAYQINIDFKDEIARAAETMKPAEALGCLKELTSALWKLENNANLRLLLEVVLLGWPVLEKPG